MKIIKVDNFARDYISDCLIADNVPTFYAQPIADALNKQFSSESSSDYYQAVGDDYKLFIFEP